MSQATIKANDSNNSTSARLSRSERFNLVLALIGLSADTISIGTFLFAGVHLDSKEISSFPKSVIALLVILSSAVLLYSWIAIGWFFIRKSTKMQIRIKPGSLVKVYGGICLGGTTFSFVATLPGWLMLFCLLSSDFLGLSLFIFMPIVFGLILAGFYHLIPMMHEDMLPYLEEIWKEARKTSDN